MGIDLLLKKGDCVDHLAPNSNSCTKAQSDIGMECQDTGAQCNNGKDRVRKNAKCKMQKESGQWKMVKLEGGKVQLWQHLNNNINSCFLQMPTLCEVWIIVIDGFLHISSPNGLLNCSSPPGFGKFLTCFAKTFPFLQTDHTIQLLQYNFTILRHF